MKKENSFSRNHVRAVLLLVVLVLAFIYLFLYDFSRRVDHLMTDMTTEHLADVNDQSQTAVKNELTRVFEEVRYTADFLSETPELTEESRQRVYEQLKEKCGFANIRLVSADGGLYTVEHEELPHSTGGYVEGICRGESGMTDVFPSSVTGQEVFAFYAPVRRGETVEGGIAGIMIVEQMVDMVTTNGFNSGSYSYVLKSDGTVIMQTSHADSLYSGRDYFSFLRSDTDMGEEAVEELQEKMERKERGVFLFTYGKEKRIVYYAPAQINDWYVLTVVPYTVSNWYREHIGKTALYLTVKMLLLFLAELAVIVLWFRKTRNIILDSKTALELEKKKLELALLHSTGTTFEYVPKDDSLSFISPPVVKTAEFPPVLYQVSAKGAACGLVAPEDLEKWRMILKRAAEGKEPDPLEFAGGTSFSEDTYFRLSVTPVIVGKGEVANAIGTLEDITEERRIRRQFAQEEQYRAALLSEAVAMWSVDLVKQQVLACTIHGKDWMEDGSGFLYSSRFVEKMCRYIHPADHDRIAGQMQANRMLAAYYTGEREQKELFRAAYPGSDDYKWMTCTISLLTEPVSGNPVAFAYVRDVDEETKRKMELLYSSERDPLTGLYNRRNIEEKVEQALKHEDSLSCLMMLDLDGFKEINDRYGHQEGDAVLKKMARILSGAFRSDDLIARFGGDEFVVFLERIPNRECASFRAEEVRRQVYALTMDGEDSIVSISIGIAFSPQDGNTFELLYRHADEALYSAKGRGKNQIAFYGEEEEIMVLERLD